MSPLPPVIEPMLAEAGKAFDSPDHSFEVKWDGIRCIAFADPSIPGGIRLQSRNLNDLTDRFPELTGVHGIRDALDGKGGMVLDGEVVAFNHGKPSFLAIQPRIHTKGTTRIQQLSRSIPTVFVAFDILYDRDRCLFALPWTERRGLLEATVAKTDHVQVSDATPGAGLALFEAAKSLGLEGIVAKAHSGTYLPGKRSSLWTKAKATRTEEFVICGYTLREGGRSLFSSLVLGAPLGDGWAFCGMVGTGFSGAVIDALVKELDGMGSDTPPDPSWTPKTLASQGFFRRGGSAITEIVWTRPELVCSVEYLELTDTGVVRHGSYKGLRRDLGPEDCRRDGGYGKWSS